MTTATRRRSRNPGRISELAYAQRHVIDYLTGAQAKNLLHIAGVARNGRARITNAQIADRRSLGKRVSERTVRGQTGAMVRSGRFLRREGWTYVLVGYAEHDVRYCDHQDCINDAAALTNRPEPADETTILRRKKDAYRKRQQRAARAGTPSPSAGGPIPPPWWLTPRPPDAPQSASRLTRRTSRVDPPP